MVHAIPADLDAVLRALGLHPIAGGSDGESPADPPPGDPPGDPPPGDPGDEPEPAPVAVDPEVAALRERLARVEGELQAARAKPAPEPRKAADVWDAERIEKEWSDGRISEAARIQYHAQLVAQQMRAQERAEEERDRPVRTAEEKLQGLIGKYPDLRDTASDLFAKVREAAGELAYLGLGMNDPRLQVLAVERVVGGHRLGGAQVNEREQFRRRTPTGGAGSGGAGGGGEGGGKPDPLKGIPREIADYWRERGWIPDDAAKARYADRWRQQQANRRARLQTA